jgi:hypothetical protein
VECKNGFGAYVGKSFVISGINLSGLGLTGTLPASLSALQFVTSLDLSNNPSLHGDIPSSWTTMTLPETAYTYRWYLESLNLSSTLVACEPMPAWLQAWSVSKQDDIKRTLSATRPANGCNEPPPPGVCIHIQRPDAAVHQARTERA